MRKKTVWLVIGLPVFLGLVLLFFAGVTRLSTPPKKNLEGKASFLSPLSRRADEPDDAKPARAFIFGRLLQLFKPGLSEKIETQLKEVKGTYGIYLEDLADGEVFGLNENETFYMASLYKLMVMYYFYDQVAQGTLKPTDAVGNSTWSEAVESMITVSDNLAGESLGTRLGWEKIEAEMESLGLTKTRLGADLISTPADIATLLEKMAFGEAVSAEASLQMVETLLRQKLNSRLPRYLPPAVEVAHKTGELDEFRHDAGIVILPSGRSFIIVVMSKDSGPDAVSAEVIAQIARVAYDHFSRKDR